MRKTFMMARERPVSVKIYVVAVLTNQNRKCARPANLLKTVPSLFVCFERFPPPFRREQIQNKSLIIFQQSWHQNRSSNNILIQGLKMSFFNHKITNCLSCKKIKKMNVSLLSSSWYFVLYGEKLTSFSFTNVKIWDMSLSFPARNHKELIVSVFQLNFFQPGIQLLS